MKPKTSFWQRIGLHDWFLKKEAIPYKEQPHSLTPNDVYHYIIEKFKESISTLSFANRVVFYHEYIICFNPDDYKQFMENMKGIFGIIVQESLKKIYELLKEYQQLVSECQSPRFTKEAQELAEKMRALSAGA